MLSIRVRSFAEINGLTLSPERVHRPDGTQHVVINTNKVDFLAASLLTSILI